MLLAVLVLVAAGCGGSDDDGQDGATPLASGLALLPDDEALHRHVLVADLARLREAYPDPDALREALVAVWLPDALVGAASPLWHESYGLRLQDVSAFASAGFHPAEVAVVDGAFTPASMEEALTRSGYVRNGDLLARGDDGSLDVEFEAGRLALSSLNRIALSPTRLTAASTTALAGAAGSPPRPLGAHADFAALADALDPITSAILIDPDLVRPLSGEPVTLVTQHAPALVGVGIDDSGPDARTLKIAFVYAEAEHALADAELMEGALDSISLPGAPGARFTDIGSEWEVSTSGRTVVVTARIGPEQDVGAWRLLVERGDLSPLVKPSTESP